jgi:hypothetical protein
MHFLRGALDDQDWQLHSWFGNIDTQGQFFIAPPNVPALMQTSTLPEGIPVSVTTDPPHTGKAKVAVRKRGRARASTSRLENKINKMFDIPKPAPKKRGRPRKK